MITILIQNQVIHHPNQRNHLLNNPHYELNRLIILKNHSNYTTVCLLLDTSHLTDHRITVCSKWIFDSNLEIVLPLTKALLDYICSGNDTDEITFVGVWHAIRAVPPIVVQRKLNI